jgi:hypothetical protein
MSGAALATAFVAGVLVATTLSPTGANASSLIVDGNFSSPDQGGGYNVYYPSIDGWFNSNGDGVEIGTSTIYGMPCISIGCQHLEVNANTFDTINQTVSGLIVGETYNLVFDYGGRPGGGPQMLDVNFGGVLLAVDTGSYGTWTLNSFGVVATSTTETLTFSSVDTSELGGLPTYGNEITNVALFTTPLPSTWTMLIAGFIGFGYFAYRGSKKNAASVAAI